MPYPAKAIANDFLALAEGKGQKIDPMKMQKLVYFAHGWCLALKDAPLIVEKIEAWRYGPVIRTLYNAFKDCGNAEISHPAYDVQMDGLKVSVCVPTIADQEADNEIDGEFARELLEEIWKVYGEFDAIQLSNLTHADGSPWDEIWKKRGRDAVISDDLIKSYFKAQQAAKA